MNPAARISSSLSKSMLAASIIALSSATSSAALLLTFTEEGGNVVMRATGSVDASTATFAGDSTTNGTPSVTSLGVRVGNTGAYDAFDGVDLLPTGLVTLSAGGLNAGNGGGFIISNEGLYVFGSGIADDEVANNVILSSSREFTVVGQTFATLGLDNHAVDTDIGLWRASAGAGDAGTINFRVSTVPEPSSTALLGLGGLALILRRRR